MSILVPLESARDRERCGGKGRNLAFLIELGLPVPAGRVVPADEFAKQLAACDPTSDLGEALTARPLRPELAAELASLVAELGGRVSVRSSATLEDGKTHSFAGQFLTVLDVGADGIETAVRRVWASTCSASVRAYLQRAGLPAGQLQMAVVVQRQLGSQVSGVAMGRAGQVAVEAVYGQGEALVGAELPADHWEVRSGRILSTRLAKKTARRVLPAGPPRGELVREDVPEREHGVPSLSEAQVLEVARVCERIAAACSGHAQDCEFAFAEGALQLLQTRDVTASLPVSVPPLPSFAAPGKGAWEVDSGHFQKPCTRLFQELFPAAMRTGFARAMERYGALLSHVDIEFVNGFTYVRMRPLMAPEDATSKPPPPAFVFKIMTRLLPPLRKRIRTAEAIWERREWRVQLAEWQEAKAKSIATHLRLQAVNLDKLSESTLAAHFEAVCSHVQAMVEQHHSYNLASLTPIGDLLAHLARWSGGKISDSDVLALLTGAAPTSAELRSPDSRVVGTSLAADPTARELLRLDGSDTRISDADGAQALETLRAIPGSLGEQIRQFLSHREYRLVEGLDPGAACLHEFPSLLWHALRTAALAAREPPISDSIDADGLQRVRAAVPSAHHAQLDAMIAEARAVAALRDERALYSDVWAWGILRTTVVHIGRRLMRRNHTLLVQATDLVHASSAEILSLLQHSRGPSATELETRAAYRRAYAVSDAPARLGPAAYPPPSPDLLPAGAARLTAAVGAVFTHMIVPPTAKHEGAVLRGAAASGGQWEGPAYLVSSQDDVRDIPPGSVLVVGAGSSSFTMLAPLAAAVVCEGGGLLSHVAIVCREYRIPCVCGCVGALAKLKSGQRVRVDGTHGTVEIIDAAQA